MSHVGPLTVAPVLTVSACFAAPEAPPSDDTPRIDALIHKLKSSDVGERNEGCPEPKEAGGRCKGTGRRGGFLEMSNNDPEVQLRELAKTCLDAIRRPINIQIRKPITIFPPVRDPVKVAIRQARKLVGGDRSARS